MCETYWVEKHMTFEDLANLYASVIHYPESIQRNDDPGNRFDSKTVIQASGLLQQLQNPVFIIPFQTFCYINGYTKEISTQLQNSTVEIIEAYEMVSLVVEQSVR